MDDNRLESVPTAPVGRCHCVPMGVCLDDSVSMYKLGRPDGLPSLSGNNRGDVWARGALVSLLLLSA